MNITDIESDADLPVNEPNGIHIRFLLWKIQGKAYKTAYLTFTFFFNLNNECRMPIMVTKILKRMKKKNGKMKTHQTNR